MATLTSLLGRTANSSCRFSSPPKREQIQVEARKSVLGEDRQPTQNPDLINAAFLLSRPTWDYNSAEGKERLQVYRQTLMAGLQAAMSKPSNLAKVYDVRQVTGRPETWPRSCWPRQWRTHRKNGRTSRSWLQGQIQLSEKLGQDSRKVGSPSHLSPPNYLENLQIFLKIYEFGLRFKERPAGTATVRRIPASISVRHPDEVIHLAFTCLMLEGVRILLLHHRQKGKLCKNFEMPPTAHNLPAPGQGQQPSIWRTCSPQAPAVSFTSVHHLDPGLKIRTWIPVPFKISMNAFFLKTSKVTKSEM
ncbi:uncharacterized protein [Canis lupus baileyi]|uniref:uncharacterized protein isoform X1 n=1 Tax=Canis lupus baileyi TaxID=143281 RepID=UPI003B97245E